MGRMIFSFSFQNFNIIVPSRRISLLSSVFSTDLQWYGRFEKKTPTKLYFGWAFSVLNCKSKYASFACGMLISAWHKAKEGVVRLRVKWRICKKPRAGPPPIQYRAKPHVPTTTCKATQCKKNRCNAWLEVYNKSTKNWSSNCFRQYIAPTKQ